jgi:hypothetical protein
MLEVRALRPHPRFKERQEITLWEIETNAQRPFHIVYEPPPLTLGRFLRAIAWACHGLKEEHHD